MTIMACIAKWAGFRVTPSMPESFQHTGEATGNH